jgi:TolA-binding protein
VLAGAGTGLAVAAVLSLLLALVRRRKPSYDPGVPSQRSDDRAAELLADRLEQRLAARESALAARERDLQQKIDELRALGTRPEDSNLDERERRLEERVAAVTKRELAVARAAAAAATPAPPPAAPPPAAAPPPPRAAVTRADGGAYNLTQLERLVDERGGAHPERREEWESYLYFLREYAAADGSLPLSFDSLVEDTFGALLA